MSSQVVRVQGFSKGSLGAIGKEVERNEKDLLENRNEDIDKSRTHLNEFYKQTNNGMYGEWQDVCKNLNVTNSDNLKKNAIAFEGMIITSNKEFFEKLGYVPGEKPPEKVREFFEKSYEFAKQEIGFKGTDKNILCASVHYDETTPHLQLYYVPVVDNWKEKVLQKDENGKVVRNEKGSPIQARDDKGKLIWNNITDSKDRKLSRDSFWKNKGGNSSYTKMQDRFYEQISKEYGLGRGEKGSTKEHTTKAEWQAQKLEKELKAKDKELTSHQKKIEKLKSELEYAKDGSVLVPALANKTKTAEIQDQNKGLKREIYVLQAENGKLKDENSKLKAEQQAQADALKDRSSVQRLSLDALDRQNIYKTFIAKPENKDLEQAMKPFEKALEQAHKVGQDMVKHKQGYVDCLERRKSAQIDVKQSHEYKTTLETNLGQIRAIGSDLNHARNRLEKLEQEKSETPVINLPKQAKLNKQIKECSAEIKGYEETLENKFDMKNRTDEHCIADEIRWHEGTINKCIHEINEKSNLADNLTLQAQEHLKAYKSIHSVQKAFEEPYRNIINRHDKEYTPPQEYKFALEPYNTQGLPRGQAQQREHKKHTLAEMKYLVNQHRAEQLLKEPKPKIHTKSKGRGYGE